MEDAEQGRSKSAATDFASEGKNREILRWFLGLPLVAWGRRDIPLPIPQRFNVAQVRGEDPPIFVC